MKKTHVDDMANRHCGKLSKGYKQRVGLAQALIHDPEVLDPRRADGRPRPEADHRDARSDSQPRRQPHDHPEHAHPAGSRADLPARRHHQQGPRRRGRHAGEPDAPAQGRLVASTCRSKAPARHAGSARERAGRARKSTLADRHDGDRRATRSRPSRTTTSAATSRARSSTAAGACSSCGRRA